MRLNPISTIKLRLGINEGGRIQRFFTDTCDRYMNDFIPLADTGNLRNIKSKGVNYITYESPYAHAQYIGVVHGSPVRNYTTPGTGPYWDKRMWSAKGQQVISEVQKELNKHGN